MGLARWWAHRKLHRGRCGWCGAVLTDDNASGFCSSEHAALWDEDRVLG